MTLNVCKLEDLNSFTSSNEQTKNVLSSEVSEGNPIRIRKKIHIKIPDFQFEDPEL
jgi:hypothetical protein